MVVLSVTFNRCFSIRRRNITWNYILPSHVDGYDTKGMSRLNKLGIKSLKMILVVVNLIANPKHGCGYIGRWVTRRHLH